MVCGFGTALFAIGILARIITKSYQTELLILRNDLNMGLERWVILLEVDDFIEIKRSLTWLILYLFCIKFEIFKINTKKP